MDSCSICGNNKNLFKFKVKELELGMREIFDYIYCPACGCIQIDKIPKNLAKYYPSCYYSFDIPSISTSFIKKILKNLRNSYAIKNNKINIIGFLLSKKFPPSKSIEALSKIKNITTKSKLLDVGCGEGSLLINLDMLDFKNLHGIDPYLASTKKVGKHVILYKSDLISFTSSILYDLIMFHHSFEHLIEDPLVTLKKVYGLLNSKGKCIIRMPTTSSFAWEYYRENWVGLQAPRHIRIYSIRGFEILAQSAGFCIESISYDSTEFSFIASEQYKKNIALNDDNSYFRNPYNSIFKKEDVEKYKKLASEFNKQCRGDMICVVLKKKQN